MQFIKEVTDMSEPKTKGEELKEALCYQPKNLTETMTKEELEQALISAKATRTS